MSPHCALAPEPAWPRLASRLATTRRILAHPAALSAPRRCNSQRKSGCRPAARRPRRAAVPARQFAFVRSAPQRERTADDARAVRDAENRDAGRRGYQLKRGGAAGATSRLRARSLALSATRSLAVARCSLLVAPLVVALQTGAGTSAQARAVMPRIGRRTLCAGPAAAAACGAAHLTPGAGRPRRRPQTRPAPRSRRRPIPRTRAPLCTPR